MTTRLSRALFHYPVAGPDYLKREEKEEWCCSWPPTTPFNMT